MGIKKAQRYCADEQKLVLAEQQTPNHLLHLALSVLTFGIWVPVWLILCIFEKPFRCPSCGGKTMSRAYYNKEQRRLRKEAKRIEKQGS